MEDILKCFKYFFKSLKPNGFYIIEDFKHPNFYKHLDLKNEPKIDRLINFFKKKKVVKSNILNNNFQKNVINQIESINDYKGLLKDSFIVFLKKLN